MSKKNVLISSKTGNRPVPSLKPSLLDKLRWFSPRTWWGIAQLQDALSFCEFNLQSLIHGSLGILLPLLVLTLLRTAQLSSSRLLLVTLVSPWTFGSIATIGLELRQMKSTCARWAAIRKPIVDDAREALQHRIRIGRAHHTRRYDIYLPLTFQGQALLFFPGACVPHIAYSEVAGLLSDEGLVVVVVSMEPVYMPSPNLGADAKPMRRIMQQVDHDFLPYPAEWSLGGHSMGSFAAMRLVSELQPSRFVFWGMGPFPEIRTNLSNTNCRVLVINGSNDPLCEYTPVSHEEFRRALPPHSVYKTIRGGTHDGFATYPNDPIFDGIPGITKEKQHRLVVAATSTFLLQSKR